MISAISVHAHSVSRVPLPQLRELVSEVQRHGPDAVFDNRASRADIFRANKDEEFAQEAEREAGYILDVFV